MKSIYRTRFLQLRTGLAAALIVGLLAACADTPPMATGPDWRGLNNEMDQQQKQADADRQQQPVFAVVKDQPYIGGQYTQLPRVETLPAVFKTQVSKRANNLTLHQIADWVTRQSGLPVAIQPILDQPPQQTSSGTGTNLATGLQNQPGSLGASALGAFNPLTLMGPQIDMQFYSPNYSGTLAGFLDTVATHFGAYWQVRDGEIYIYKTDTVSFKVALPTGSTTSSMALNNSADLSGAAGSGSSGSGGGSAADAVFTSSVGSNIQEWSDVVTNIKSMLSSYGSTNPDQGASLITVTDTPAVLSHVDDYIRAVNLNMSRQVAFSYNVYAVSMAEDKALGFDLTLAYQNLAKQYGFNLTPASPVSPPVGVGSLTTTIIQNAPGAIGQWSGTQFLVNVLNSVGTVREVDSGGGMTLDNQMVQTNDLNAQGYVASTTVTSTAQVGTAEQQNTAILSTGFSMQFLPNILDSENVTLRYGIKLSKNNGFGQSKDANGDVIQLPNFDSMSNLQSAAMHTGSTLVLAGLVRDQDSASESNGAASYNKQHHKQRTMLIITLTVNSVPGVKLASNGYRGPN